MIRPTIINYPPPEQVKICIDVPSGVVIMAVVISDGVSFCRPNTDEEIQKEVNKNYAGMPWRRITNADIPPDRTFRNAWKSDGKVITHDIAKAIEIEKDILRVQRAPVLDQLDAEYLKADEAGDTVLKVEIAEKKQILRDITVLPELLNAKTVSELKAISVEKVLADYMTNITEEAIASVKSVEGIS